MDGARVPDGTVRSMRPGLVLFARQMGSVNQSHTLKRRLADFSSYGFLSSVLILPAFTIYLTRRVPSITLCKLAGILLPLPLLLFPK